MNTQQVKKLNLPKTPGVYQFIGEKGKILYIGKATSLRDRVRSYFDEGLIDTRGIHIQNMVARSKRVKVIPTDSVLEALLLETELIKTHRPPSNTKEKDDKSWNHIVITDEEFPRVLLVRGKELEDGIDLSKVKFKREVPQDSKPMLAPRLRNAKALLLHSVRSTSPIKRIFGPFPKGTALREAMRIIRKIFPFRDTCSPANLFGQRQIITNTSSQKRSAGKPGAGKPCFNAQIGLCPGVCTGAITSKEYARTIRHIILFCEGRKKALILNLKKDMRLAAKKLQFEEAERIKRTIFALGHIQDIALMKRTDQNLGARIEAYDIAHISGTAMSGAMVVVEDGVPIKAEYRKFTIKSVAGSNDTAALREVLGRRFSHPEWPYPRLIVIDGGVAQKNTAECTLSEMGLGIPIVSVVKDDRHRAREILGDKTYTRTYEREIILANAEAHRFALTHHKVLRRLK